MVQPATELPKLRVQNTLTGNKDEFSPVNPEEVTWYTCGPTVYDDSHMGHARTYVSFDIIRRIMTDYFGYNINLVMNITDVDDKIIRKSNEANVNFTEISRHYEAEFMDDMRRLNVGLPTVITRVSEYMPEIIAYIAKIIEQGYAYESNGSVYFNVDAFNASPDHRYNKLEPGASNDTERAAEGEGVLADANVATDKKGPKDFALWKKSKENEPKWDSPWGEGRPGWHIECSAMAGAILPNPPIDIHTGGIDLKFPHHDNELAQSEAYYGCDNWVNHFWHTGHLHIAGRKMSKSLKNFITIKQILDKYNARQIRMVFLLHNWGSLMNYSEENTWAEAVAKERQFNEFFRSVKAFTRNIVLKDSVQRWEAKDFALKAELLRSQKAVRAALSDSFDTPTAVLELGTLVSATNTYLQGDDVKLPLVLQVSRYIFSVLKAFGVYEAGDTPQVLANADEAGSGTGESVEDAIAPVMDAMRDFRDQIKKRANEGPKTMFQLCDEVRDDVLPFLGIKLEDRKQDQAAIWKFADKDSLLAERQAKLDKAREAEEQKRAKKELELKKKSTPGSEWFKVFPEHKDGKYTKYDAEGLPTHTLNKKNEEKELSDAQRNGIRKLLKKQDGVYAKWLQTQEPAAAQESAQSSSAPATEEEKKE